MDFFVGAGAYYVSDSRTEISKHIFINVGGFGSIERSRQNIGAYYFTFGVVSETHPF